MGEIRGLGLMAAIEIVKDKTTKEEFPAEEKTGIRIHQATDERGLFSRLRGDVYCLAPPVITPESTLKRIATILRESIDSVLGD